MNNKFTFLSYFCSKDADKLTQFVWSLPFKIEIKSMELKKDKWFIWFIHADERSIKTTLKNLDLDTL